MFRSQPTDRTITVPTENIINGRFFMYKGNDFQPDNNSSDNNNPERIEGKGITLNYRVLIVDCIKGARKFWYLLIILVMIGFSVMYYISNSNYVPEYKSSVTFTVNTLNKSGTSYSYIYNYSASSSLEKAFPYLITSPVMKNMLKDELGTSYINGSYEAEVMPSSNIFTITVTSDSARDAYDIVNAIIKCYPKLSSYVIGESEIEFIAKPEIPERPFTSSTILRDSLIGALGGFGLWAALIFLYALTRTTIRNPEDISDKLGQTCIAEIPYVKRRRNESNNLLIANKKLTLFSEAYKTLRWRLINLSSEKGYKVFAITSTLSGEGKSTVSFNVACSLADAGKSVALVDLDYKKKSIQTMLFPEEKDVVGITDVAAGDISLVNAYKTYKHKNLHVYCAGKKDTFKLHDYYPVFAQLRATYDYIIVDCPPGGLLTEAVTVTRLADSVLFVVLQDNATVRRIREVMSNLFYSNSQIAGFIFNGVKADYKNYGGYYYGGYRYGQYKYGSYKYNSYSYGRYGYGKYGKYGKYGSYGGYGGYGGYGSYGAYGAYGEKAEGIEQDTSTPDVLDDVDDYPDNYDDDE